MRKKKNGEERLNRCRALLAEKPETPIDSAERDFGKTAPVWLEIGAGKGGFAIGMTERNPDVCYYAMERVSDCVVLAAERAKECADKRPDNLRFIVGNADDLLSWFAPASVERVFLNFSDPWSKKGYRKRRLTYRKYLAVYFTLLKDGGVLRFKTDNVGLFDFSLEEIAAMGLTPDVVTRDLHHSEYNEGNVRTEYEENFASQGMNIHMLEVRKPAGYVPHYEEEKKASAKEETL
ncbi:MAG: tRNA (guanosine(46)-N7)-methyltransferase TrmB [Clostridia bacterium]|nr:tRNA (guanosine(46)-N7)-methyltransferase TrmB [Clostridia bacterium]